MRFANIINGSGIDADNYTIVRYDNDCIGEKETIGRINANSDGYFDFSKNLVDIGGYIGVYTISTNFAYSTIFEGNKEFCDIIHGNIALFGKSLTTTVNNVLLSDTEKVINYDGYECEEGGSPAFYLPYNNPTKTELLDSFNLNNIGLIKIDVEGMEEKVLRGGLGTIIRSNYPPILFECWDVGYYGQIYYPSAMTQEKHDSLFNLLQSLGYEILEHWGDYQNHLAIHK